MLSLHTITGQLKLNPNNSPQNEFVLTLTNGSTITRDNLTKDFPGYSGPASRIHLKPKGSGKQNELIVDGAPYEIDHSRAYDITSSAMTVRLYNDRIDKQGRAMGHWWISLEATDATITVADQERSKLDGLVPLIAGSHFTNFYVWGLDLSGTLQGAGGVGGLLCMIPSRGGVAESRGGFFPTCDGNGNISDYVDTNGLVVAHREYDPFGNTVVATGLRKDDFSFWFSSKYLDQESGLYYYGYRYYSPSLGRWLSRDPIGEKGFESIRNVTVIHTLNKRKSLNEDTGKNYIVFSEDYDLYIFVLNNPVNFIDYLGNGLLCTCSPSGYATYFSTWYCIPGSLLPRSLGSVCVEKSWVPPGCPWCGQACYNLVTYRCDVVFSRGPGSRPSFRYTFYRYEPGVCFA